MRFWIFSLGPSWGFSLCRIVDFLFQPSLGFSLWAQFGNFALRPVKVNAFPLHVYHPMAPLKPFRFMRSFGVSGGPCLLWPFTLEPCCMSVSWSAGRRPSRPKGLVILVTRFCITCICKLCDTSCMLRDSHAVVIVDQAVKNSSALIVLRTWSHSSLLINYSGHLRVYSTLISVDLLESQATGDYTLFIVVSRAWSGIKVGHVTLIICC